MNLLSLFNSKARAERDRQEANRIRRYEYGLREVARWTQAKVAYAKSGAELTQQFEEQIARHGAQWGYEGEGMKALRWTMASFQDQTEYLIQEADYRLSVYRNIVLMKGRM